MPLPTEKEWREWLPQIERIAISVGRRNNASPTVRDELTSSAVAHVYERISHFDSTRASFATWCQVVLRNYCVSLIRREASRVTRGKRYVERVAHEHAQRLLDAPQPTPLEIDENTSADDLRPKVDIVAMLERHLQPIDRILIVVYAEMSSACGPETLARWCEEAGGIDTTSLPPIESLPKSARKKALAGLLGESLDWVRQRMFRATKRLQQIGLGDSGS